MCDWTFPPRYPMGSCRGYRGECIGNLIFSLGHLMHRLRSGAGGSLAPTTPQTEPVRPSFDEGKTLHGSQTLSGLPRCSTGDQIWSRDGVREREGKGCGMRGHAGETFCFLLSRYSGPTWLIQISRSRLAMVSDGVVAEDVPKYPRHTQTAHRQAVAHLRRGGLLPLSSHGRLLDNAL